MLSKTKSKKIFVQIQSKKVQSFFMYMESNIGDFKDIFDCFLALYALPQKGLIMA